MQATTFSAFEEQARGAVHWMQLAVEAAGALVIALGVVLAAVAFVRSLSGGDDRRGYARVRLTLAHYLALALEFLLAADILATAISPTWDQIGKLAAIAAIRTGLNYFLMREMRDEGKEAVRGPGDGGAAG
ncbi:MAG TPA: DUF1622 domain-containing protein [Longimicrobium sp.]